MGMHDLFGVVDDPVTEACRMLAEQLMTANAEITGG